MSLQNEIAKIFQDWGRELNSAERKALEKKVKGYNVNDWKAEHIGMVVASGAGFGAIGGWVGLGAIMPDLLWCKKVGIQGCLGIGYIQGRYVDYDQDMNMILSIWTELGEAATFVPAGKVGIKISNKATVKMAGKVAGKIVEKAALKGGSKLGAKLAGKAASKAAAKLAAKLAAKTGVGWIPLIGGAVSGGVNWWLLNGLLDAAEKYYRGDCDYLVLHDSELASAV